MKILVTGGLGYIGSHTIVELLNNGHDVVALDNLSNSKIETKQMIEKIANKSFRFIEGDCLNGWLLREMFNDIKFDAVIHFAAFKSVGESVSNPLKYYSNNITSTLNLLSVMQAANVKNFIFSSSATVYSETNEMPVTETSKTSTKNPYGETKLMVEKILTDLHKSDNSWNITLLRYFNPVGAHESGLIGEDPNGIPNNIMPYICKVATGELEILNVFGDTYGTIDGTGVRDFIHVVDLAKGHVKALDNIINSGLKVYNLGTGTGYSVLQLIDQFEKVSGKKINYRIVEKREGDLGECYANCSKANKELNWYATKTIYDICKDAWNFENNKKWRS